MLDQKEIEAKAQEIFSEYNPKEEIPFPFENLQRYNVEFFTGKEFEELFDRKTVVRSIISFDGTKSFRVYVNHKLPLEVVYFSMATSIAHVFLHEAELKKEKILFDIEEYPLVSPDIDPALSRTLREEA